MNEARKLESPRLLSIDPEEDPVNHDEPPTLKAIIDGYLSASDEPTADTTRMRYHSTLNSFSEAIGSDATAADLTAENYDWWIECRRGDVSPNTLAGDAEKIILIWNQAAKLGLCDPPTVTAPEKFYRPDDGYSDDEVKAIHQTARVATWRVGMVPARMYWPALLGVLYESAKGLDAVFELAAFEFDTTEGTVTFGGELVELTESTAAHVAALITVRPTKPFAAVRLDTLYPAYRRLLSEAGVERSRGKMFDAWRRRRELERSGVCQPAIDPAMVRRPEAPAAIPAAEPKPIPPANPDAMLLSDAVEKYISVNQSVRSRRTINGHRSVSALLSEFIGRPATVDDLTEDVVAGWFRHRETVVTRNTVNGEACTLIALWRWLALRHLAGPATIGPPSRVAKAPRALSLDQLRALFRTVRTTRLTMEDVPGHLYWPPLLSILWQCGERVGSVRQLGWENIDLSGGWVRFPAATRKFGTSDLVRPVNADAVEQLKSLYEASPDTPFGAVPGSGWYALWHSLRSEAGLPRWVTPHAIRKSVASHLPSLSDACEMLGHSSSAVTKRNYRDPTYGDGRALLAKLPDVSAKPSTLSRWFRRAK